MVPVELLPAPRRAAQEQTVLRGPKAMTAASKQADPVDPTDPPEATADSKQADPVGPTDPMATTADSKQADPVDPTDPPEATVDSKQADPADPLAKTADSEPTHPPEATADSEPTDPFGPTAWAEQPRLLVPESPLTDRDPPSQSLLSRSQAFNDRALTVLRPMVLRPVVRLRTSPGTLRALDPSTSAAKADFTPSTDPKAANAPAHRI
jgi:hypothetical protein